MQQNANLTLTTLRCVIEKNPSSSPYIWPALAVINESKFSVAVISPTLTNDGVVIQSNLQAGQTAPIPSSVGVLSFQFDSSVATDAILVVALWQKNGTPGNVVDAGFLAFTTTLHDALQANLLTLTDPQTQQAVKIAVQNSVTTAITNSLSPNQKVEIWAGDLILDSLVDNSSQRLPSLAPSSFTLTLGDPLGGRLLSYGDNGSFGNVSNPVVVGFGGWADFKFLFAGGTRIYAVNQDGQLLSYGDNGNPGNVSDPIIVGFGGWAGFKFLFAGGSRIYAVNQDGQLLSYGDNGNPGNVSDPVIVGFGGWAGFKFLFAGESRIYAVNQNGQLLSYEDNGTTGNVSDPIVISSGWASYRFLFAGGNQIYVVDQNGMLLSYEDNGTPNLLGPVVVGFGGWADFKLLFAGGNRIYAAENPSAAHHYEIDYTLQVAAALCVTEQANVNAAKATIQNIMSSIASLQAEARVAIGPQKLALFKLIQELEKTKLVPAQAALENAEKALAACQARSFSLQLSKP